jgi:Protein of unknown function (DUF1566)
MKKSILFIFFFLIKTTFFAQNVAKTMLRLPDTGQTAGFTTTFGEDNDYNQNVPFFINKNALVTSDTVTSLMWQRTDGGEMTIENAAKYCDTLTLGGFTDWRLPTPHEAFSILNLQNNKPALDTKFFTKTTAEYWWTSAKQADDATKIWCTNAGGGIGNHPKTETISAGGTKPFHVRAVRDVKTPTTIAAHFTDNGNGTITDNLTNLVWQKTPNPTALTWEDALKYAENLTFATASDWRLPNIKELQSLNDESIVKPSINKTFFPSVGVNKFWSSTSLPNATTKAWYLSTQYGITTYDEKSVANYVICVRKNVKTTANQDVLVEKDEIKVFSNPFGNHIKIENAQGDETYELSNSVGQIFYKGKNIETKDFSTLTKGIYFLKINEKKVLKMIKE